MIKILSSEQIRQADQFTIQNEPISSLDLMERAATLCAEWILIHREDANSFDIVCGIGNNGGDGLVIARHLITHGYNVHTYVVNCSDKRSKDFLINYDRIKNVTKDWPTLLSCKEEFPELHKDDIIVDAIFGIGTNRESDDWVKNLFQHFRKSSAFTLSVVSLKVLPF